MSKQVALASAADADAVIAAAAAAFPAWRDTSLAKRTQVLFRFRELLNNRKHEAAEIITSEHGKVLSDALGEITRGQEIVELACGLSHLLKGSLTENASTRVDVSSIRQPLGRGRHHLAVRLPGDGADVVLPDRGRRRQRGDPQTVGEGPEHGELAGRPVEGGRPSRRHLQRAARRQGRRRRAVDRPAGQGDQLRRLDPDRAVRVHHRHRPRQTGAGPGRGEEPHAGAPGRRPGPGRGRRGQRRLRLRRRTLHGHQRVGRGGRGRRRADRQDHRPDGHPAHRGRAPRRRHGPVGHRRAPGQGRRLRAGRRRRRRRTRRGRPGRQPRAALRRRPRTGSGWVRPCSTRSPPR